ncbi:MAG: hypothetical protein ACK4MV_16215 [Beijerinckiaceae bacterium]
MTRRPATVTQEGEPDWKARCAELDKILSDRFRRTVKAEETLMAAALGKRPPLTLDECRDLANLIGKPENTPPDMPIAIIQAPDSLVRAEIQKIGDAIMETQKRLPARIAELEEALRPFVELAIAVEQHLPAKDDRWALVRVREKSITHADLKRAKEAMDNGGLA